MTEVGHLGQLNEKMCSSSITSQDINRVLLT
jgi:hypothetical protein